MKIIINIVFLMLILIVQPVVLYGQKITIDTSTNTIDISNDTSDIEFHLNAVKKHPEFPGGKLRGIGADTNCGYGIKSEVIRCIQKSPDWIPAETASGRKISFTLRTVVIFLVQRDNISITLQ